MEDSDIPAPDVQARSVREGIEEPLKEGQVWCVLSLRWWDLWSEYSHYKTDLTSPAADPEEPGEPEPIRRTISGPQSGSLPPPIDNTNLTLRPTEQRPMDGGPLQRDLAEYRDFMLVPEGVWELLHGWYGGGPELKRSVISLGGKELLVELYPLQLTLYKVDSGGHPVPSSATELQASRRKLLKDFLEEIHQAHAPEAASAAVLKLWHRPDSSLDQTEVMDTAGWETLGPDKYTLEEAGLSDGVSLLLEQKNASVGTAEAAGDWPLYARLRQEYRTSHFKDPHSKDGPPLTKGDQIDASATTTTASGYTWLKWFPSTIVDEDSDRVLVQFHYREKPPMKIPEMTREKKGGIRASIGYWGSSTPQMELTDETTAALRKVFDYYSKLDSKESEHMDKRSIAACLSCASNSICQKEDYRVTHLLREHDKDTDDKITVDEFIAYWEKKVNQSSYSANMVKEELPRLYQRVKVDVGSPTDEEKLLMECKEWLARSSSRLAAWKTHHDDYPYISADKRDFRDFRSYQQVSLKVGKEWFPARVNKVDWNDFSVLIELNNSASSGGSFGPAPGVREWLPMESDRLAPFESMGSSIGDISDPSPKAASATAVTGACDTPGACGLNNLGNTCFMNSVLQALSNSVPLRSYYTSDDFKEELSDSPLSMGGRLAKGFADLLQQMWADSHKACSPTQVKALVGEKRPEFRGYQQHDAHELLTFLLDALHEDGNRAPYPRPMTEDPTLEGKTEAQVADESWEKYLMRNNSKIVDLFQFQVRSEVTFPTVGEKSLTFDPMMYLTLPVPKPPFSVQVTVCPLSYPEASPVKCDFEIPKDRSFKDLEAYVLEKFPPSDVLEGGPRCFIFADLYDKRVYRFFKEGDKISTVRSNDDIWAFEVALEPGVPEARHDFWAVHVRRKEKSTYTTSSYYSSSYGSSSSGYSFKRFAPPRVFASQPGKATGADVQARVMEFADRLKRFIKTETPLSLTTTTSYGTDEGTPLRTDSAFKLGMGDTLALNFTEVDSSVMLPLPVSAGSSGSSGGSSGSDVSLSQCLDAFQRTEELAQEDWVYCRKTAEFEKSLKKLDVWNLPQLLIIHLKRFGRDSLVGPIEKIETAVQFPAELDMSTWVRGGKPEVSTRYELYGVVNHSGSLGFGHYTAYGRIERQWYNFNDSSVSKASPDQVVSKAAYILFYERIG